MKTTHIDLFPETLLVSALGGHSFTTSLKVAEHFGKLHRHVLRDVQAILQDLNESKIGLIAPSFEPAEYLDSRGRAKPMYHLSRDAFSLLAMGFTGTKALVWKVQFLAAFNAMEAQLHANTARYAAALDQLRPNLRPIVEATQAGHSRAAIAAPLGKSCNAVTYHRRSARRLGLLVEKTGGAA